MIKIAKDKEMVSILEQTEKIDQNHHAIAVMVFTERLFEDARKVFLVRGGVLCAIKVMSIEEKFLFYLINDEDYLAISPERRYAVDVNYAGNDLVGEIENLDLKIIETNDCYVFSEIDEYTFAIAKLIIYLYPNRKIYFMDKNAELFFHGIHNVTVTNSIEKIAGSIYKRCLFVSDADKRYDVKPFTDDVVNVFSSIVVMANICWARKRMQYGKRNEDKVIVVIDYSENLYLGGMGGINAIISDVLFYANKAKENGWIPVVDLQNSQYMSNEVHDSWTCYFQQLSSITSDQARESFNVIEGRENGFTWTPGRILISPSINDYRVLFSDSMKGYLYHNIPDQFNVCSRILGVIARGSDLKKATAAEFCIDDFIERVSYKSKEYDCIFLATEEEEYLKKFQSAMGEKLIYIEQKRVSYDFNNQEYKLIADLLDIRNEDRTEFGRRYLLTTYLLSKCDSIYSTINCGARLLALRWKTDAYQTDEIYYSNTSKSTFRERFYEKVLIQNRITEVINNNKLTIIYGIGRDADRYVCVREEDREKIIFCDKKAKKEKLFFKGVRVIDPEKLRDHKSVPIIISSTLFGAEIKQELLKSGIHEKDIILIRELIVR